MKVTKYLTLLAILFFLMSCNSTSVKKDIVHFDQAYIPVFSYVYQGDLTNAKSAGYYLYHEWKKLYPKYEEQFYNNEDTKEHLRQMDCWLADAFEGIDENNRMFALNQLDHARYELMELCRENNIDYYLDDVWAFEAILDVLVETASDKMLCLLEWKEFLALVEDTEKDWEIVRQKKINAQLFNLDPVQMVQLKLYKVEVTNAMADFRESMECADANVFAPKAQQIVKPFMNYLNVFGNFKASNTYIANLQY